MIGGRRIDFFLKVSRKDHLKIPSFSSPVIAAVDFREDKIKLKEGRRGWEGEKRINKSEEQKKNEKKKEKMGKKK